MLWTRALPGSVVAMAALTIPELSVGAGDLDGGKPRDKPLNPPAMTGQAGVKQRVYAAPNPLFGVRYGAMLEIAKTRPAAPQRNADPGSVAGPATGASALAKPASVDPLDAAAAYAAVMLDRFAAPPGLLAEAPLAHDAPTLDAAAAFAALTLENFVAPPVPSASPLHGSLPADLPDGGLAQAAAKPATFPAALAALPTPSAGVAVLGHVPAFAPAPAPVPASAAGIGAGDPVAPDVTSQRVARVDGKAAGVVDFQQTAAGLAVRLGSIAEVLGDRFGPAEIARIQASSASNAYLSLAQLQAHGIPVSFDPVGGEFNFGQTEAQP